MALKQYYINLDHRTEKNHRTKELFPSAKKYSAVNGSENTPKSILPYYSDTYWRDPFSNRRMTAGEVGCILSHIDLWKQCVIADEPIVILEDDLRILNPEWEAMAEHNLEDYGVLYLSRKKFREGDTYQSLNSLLESPGYTYWTCAYVIQPNAAIEFLKYFQNNPLIPADEFLPLALGYHIDSRLNETWKTPYIDSAAFKNNLVMPNGEQDSDIENGDYWRCWDFHTITVASPADKADKLLKIANNNETIINLGEGVDWHGGTMEGPGGGQKINLVRKWLSEIPHNDIVMFVDGFDTWIDQPLKEIESRYLNYNKEVIFSAESTCWPDSSIAHKFPETGGYKYLNSGTYIGTAGELHNIFSKPILDHEDDQLYCQEQYLTNKFDIVLDYESYIFLCMSGIENSISIDNNWIINTDTNCTTTVIHGNGGEVTKKAFEKLWYERFPVTFDQPKTSVITPLVKVCDTDYLVLQDDIILIRNLVEKEWCRGLVEFCNKYHSWAPLPNDKFPAREIRIHSLYNYKYFDYFQRRWKEVVKPICEKYWTGIKLEGIRDLFAIKYTMDTQRSLTRHHDHSLISGSIKLNDEYEGGELSFPRYGIDNSACEIGDIILWPGQVTHQHESKELISGEKYSLTLWTARHDGDDIISTTGS